MRASAASDPLPVFGRRLLAALALGAWAGLAIAVATIAVRLAEATLLDRSGAVAGRLLAARAAGPAALHGAAAGVVGALVASLAAALAGPPARGGAGGGEPRERHGRAARAFVAALLAGLLAALVAAGLAFLVASGRTAGRAFWLPELDGRGVREALAVVGGASLAGGLVLVLLARLRRVRRPRTAAAPAAAALAALLALAFLPAAATRALATPATRMPVREVVRDLLADPEALEVVSHGGRPPRPGVLTPSVHWALDGGDLPSLVLMPPTEVRVRVRPEDGPVRLRARAGVDASTFAYVAGDEHTDAPPAVAFEARVGARVVWSTRVPLVPSPRGTSWRDVGGARGLALAPGDVVTLRCDFVFPDGSRSERSVERVAAGFGRLLLERVTRVPRRARSREHPSIVLVVMDTERADRTSAGGYGRPTTPALEELARRGVLYENAQSAASWTWPSTASILTGLLPQEHGVTDDGSSLLQPDVETLAEALQREGYTTAAWSTNPLVSPSRGFGQGFETFVSPADDFRKSDGIVEEIRAWIAAHRGLRTFLYLHLTDPHPPYDALPAARAALAPDVPADFSTRVVGQWAPRLLRGEGHDDGGNPSSEHVVPPRELAWTSDLYDACVLSGDVAIAAVMDELAAQGLLEDTIVAYTADHGEAFLEHGLLGHGETLHQEQVHVPLVLAGPGLPRGVRVATPVTNLHLAPTLARLAGAKLARAPEGPDLARPVDGAVEPHPIVLSTEHGWWNGRFRQSVLALREGDHVLHWAPEGGPWRTPGPGPGEVRLYDLARDPGETEDLAPSEPELAAAMLARLRELVADAEARRTALPVAAGEGTRELLDRLGYGGGD